MKCSTTEDLFLYIIELKMKNSSKTFELIVKRLVTGIFLNSFFFFFEIEFWQHSV